MTMSSSRRPSRQPPHVVALTEGQVTPLSWLLSVVNDPAADPRRRDRAAAALLPFCHARPTPVGKKRQQAEEAAKASRDEWGGDLRFDGRPQ